MLTSCSPDDISGVSLSESGIPVLMNCGGYFKGIYVYDADTGRLVWSAAKPQGSSAHGVDHIEVGVLPAKDWVETSSFKSAPVPTEWRFVISTIHDSEPVTFTVAQASLSADQVFIFKSGKSVPADGFVGKTCGYDPPIPRAVTRAVFVAVGAAAVLASLAVGIRSTVARRRRSKRK